MRDAIWVALGECSEVWIKLFDLVIAYVFHLTFIFNFQKPIRPLETYYSPTSSCKTLSIQQPKPMIAMPQTANPTSNSKMHKPLNPKPSVSSTNSKVGATENALVKSQLYYKALPTTQNSKSYLAPASMKADLDVYKTNQPNRKVSVKPTFKLMQAVEKLAPDSKPIQVKLVRRESKCDEDTSSYESDSSGSSVSIETPSRSNSMARDQGFTKDIATDSVAKCDIATLLSKANIDLSQIPKKASEPLDFPGVPSWFPLRIKKILVSSGFPDALPFKSVHKLTRYRAWLEARRRQRWRRYLKAGKCRWQLSNSLKKLRQQPRSTTAAFYQHRSSQHTMWKERAIRAMKKLDVVIGGLNYLDKEMAGIFEAEREVYEKYLD